MAHTINDINNNINVNLQFENSFAKNEAFRQGRRSIIKKAHTFT